VIIEFIGSTGAGKTTLLSEVQRRLAQTTEVTTSFELVAAQLGLQGVTHPSVRNLIQEMMGMPLFMRSLPRHKALIVFTLRMLARHDRFTLITINNLRSLVRKIGVHENIRRDRHHRIVFVDEGTVLLAHNLFVYTSALYTSEEIAKFAALIPLPDVVVYIKAPVTTLVNRSFRRTDAPREMRSKSQAQVETYIHRAVTMFDQLVETEEIRSRVLIVENPDIAGKGYDEAAECITEHITRCITNFIQNYQSSGNSTRDIRSRSIKEKQYVD
jgi:deoxyadenosine/deoxycytidine kinase